MANNGCKNVNCLNIGHLNIYHLANKIPHLYKYFNQDMPFHLFGFTESRLNDCVSDPAITIPNYCVTRRDPTEPSETGIAVYIHDTVQKFTSRRYDLESKEIECLWLELKSHTNSRPLLIGFLYRNPSAKFSWYDDFVNMMDHVCKHSSDILLLGDFNIDLLKPHIAWGSTATLIGLEQMIKQPTRITSTSATLIDHIYTNNPKAVIDATTKSWSISDHCPVVCKWSSKLPKPKKKGHTCITYRSYKHFDKDAFLSHLARTPFSAIYNENDPDKALSLWYDLFLNVLNQHAPIIQKRVKSATLPLWLTPEIMKAMDTRDDLKRQNRTDEFKMQRKRVNDMIREEKKNLYDRLVKENRDVSSIWRAINVLTKGSNKQNTQTPPHLSADSFNNHFLSAADLLLPPDDCGQTAYHCSDQLKSFCRQKTMNAPPFSIPPLGMHELHQFISNMDNKKSSGLDEISPRILKLSLPYIVESLTYIYNLCIDHKEFPLALKTAKVIPIQKTFGSFDLNNYRPISILSVLSKPLERHIHKHLNQYLEAHKLYHPHQSGFRPQHSCQTALTRIVDTWLKAMNDRKITGTIFLDFQKAFDLVNHNSLLTKLQEYVSNCDVTSLFKSYLENRTQRVLLHGSYSSIGDVKCGVPQGSILGPLLFCIFINDLPLYLSNNKVACELFADDGTVHCADQSISAINQSLQESLNQISEWCTLNSMILNPTKTKSMVIATRQKHQLGFLSLDLSLSNKEIEQVETHRLLGLTVDNQLKWETHLNKMCKTVSRSLFILSKLRHYTDIETRLLFYNAYIRSHIDYVSTVWDKTHDVHLKQLNSLHRRAAKLILPDPLLTTDEKLYKLNILPLKNHLKYNKGVMMFKIWHERLPKTVCDLFTKITPKYETSRKSFKLPLPRIDIFKSSLSFSGAFLWNSLPVMIKNTLGLSSFKANLLKYFQSHGNTAIP